MGYNGEIAFNTRMKDGTPRKVCDVSKLNKLGWQAKITLEDGIRNNYEWYKANKRGE